MNATLSTRQLRLVILLVLVVVAAAGFMVVSKHKTATQPSTAAEPAGVGGERDHGGAGEQRDPPEPDLQATGGGEVEVAGPGRERGDD